MVLHVCGKFSIWLLYNSNYISCICYFGYYFKRTTESLFRLTVYIMIKNNLSATDSNGRFFDNKQFSASSSSFLPMLKRSLTNGVILSIFMGEGIQTHIKAKCCNSHRLFVSSLKQAVMIRRCM